MMKKLIFLPILVLLITISCSSINAPTTKEISASQIPINTQTPLPIIPTNTLVAPTPTTAQLPEPTTASVVFMKYPTNGSCKIQIDTQKWEITDNWKNSIVSATMVMSVSYKYGMGDAFFIKHRNYLGCDVAWATNSGFEGVDIQKSIETINGKSWEVWDINELMYKIYFWTDLKEIHFDQKSPLDVSQKESCQADVYEVLGSLQCN